MNQKNEYLKLFDEIFNTDTIKKVNSINMPMLHTIFINIIEELYRTNITYRKKLIQSNKMYDELCHTLNEKQQELLKEYIEFKNMITSIIDEQLFMFGYLTSTQLREETIENFKKRNK